MKIVLKCRRLMVEKETKRDLIKCVTIGDDFVHVSDILHFALSVRLDLYFSSKLANESDYIRTD